MNENIEPNPKCAFCGFEPHETKDCPACQNDVETRQLLLIALQREQPLLDRINELETLLVYKNDTANTFMAQVKRLQQENLTLTKQLRELGEFLQEIKEICRGERQVADDDTEALEFIAKAIESLLTSLKPKAQVEGDGK